MIMVFGFYVIFFFKQKTAYEMRISDWSSDVCSSDLCDASSGTIYPSQGNRQNPRNMLVFRGFCSELSEGVSHNLTPKRAIKNAIMARLFGVSFARWPVRLESCDWCRS